MAEVYRYKDNTLGCFQDSLHYIGFENGIESLIKSEPVILYGQTLLPGDKINGFDSGNQRTSFSLKYGHMTYVGIYNRDLLFEIYNPKAKPAQTDLFMQRPKWYLSFALIGSDAGLLMFSSPGSAYDIHPKRILFENIKSELHARDRYRVAELITKN